MEGVLVMNQTFEQRKPDLEILRFNGDVQVFILTANRFFIPC